MQYLLDTHTFLWFINGDSQLSDLWFINGDSQLSEKARSSIENPNNDCYISIASFWEMAIKLNLNKLEIEMSFKSLFKELDKNGFSLLPVTFYHTNKLISLELHHRDPFDRIIICQALIDKLTIIGKDAYFQNYKVKQVW